MSFLSRPPLKRAILVATAALLFSAAVLSVVSSADFKRCVFRKAQDHTEQAEDGQQRKVVPSGDVVLVWDCSIESFVGNRDSINAFSTVIVAALTLVLASVTVSTLRHMQESSQRELRAYMSVRWSRFRFGEHTLPDSTPCSFEICLRNHGETPAVSASASTQMGVMRMEHAEKFDFPEWRDGDPMGEIVVHKDQPRTITSRSLAVPLTEDEWKFVQRGTDDEGRSVWLWCWGVLRYTDVFGRMHWARYCFYFGGPYSRDDRENKRAALWVRHNDTSEGPDSRTLAPSSIQPDAAEPTRTPLY